MLRRSHLALAVATLALLAAIPTGSAEAAGPEEGTIVTVELELKASNGLQAKLETSDDETVTLDVERKDRQLVRYEVQGEVTEAGLTVRFGRLGTIDVAFAPAETLSATEPSEGCQGAPRTLREGIFTGTIDFTGERGYVRIEGPRAEGSMSVISQWTCVTKPNPFDGAWRASAPSSRKGTSASFHAESRRCSCFFAAGIHYPKGRGRSIFYGAKIEKHDGMEILRTTQAVAGASAFVFDHAAGTATLRPPQPLSGHATFRNRPHARDFWHSTIRVPLLGADPLRLDGSGFRLGLYPEYHFD